MQATFERNKNLKASVITVMVCAGLFLLFFFLQWTLPQIPPPVLDEGIEVNLGNSETGSGDIAPQMQGNPSVSQDIKSTLPPASNPVTQQQNITAAENTNENDEAVSTAVKRSAITKPFIENNTPKIKRITKTTVVNTKPAPPRPKALFKGGTSTTTGGNGADSYNSIRDQGIAGGKGDQGNPNGNPNSDSYTGNAGAGHSGVSIRSGLNGRRFTKFPSFEDDFNEPAKVAVDITVDKNGRVTAAAINPRGTTTTNQNIRAIALRKAKQLKLNAGTEDTQTGTIVFDFKLHG